MPGQESDAKKEGKGRDEREIGEKEKENEREIGGVSMLALLFFPLSALVCLPDILP